LNSTIEEKIDQNGRAGAGQDQGRCPESMPEDLPGGGPR